MPRTKRASKTHEESPICHTATSILTAPKITAAAVMTAATSTEYLCSGATRCRNRVPPKARASRARVNMFFMLAPRTLPTDSSGFGGSRRTAEMLVASSGKDVAKANSRLPTKRRPQPVREAKASAIDGQLGPEENHGGGGGNEDDESYGEVIAHAFAYSGSNQGRRYPVTHLGGANRSNTLAAQCPRSASFGPALGPPPAPLPPLLR